VTEPGKPAEGTPVPTAGSGPDASAGQPRIPALSADLRAAVSAVAPVATRRPKLIAAVVVTLSLLWAGVLLQSLMGLRRDLGWWPDPVLALYLAISLTAFAAHLTFALVPAPGKVLPSAYESARASVALLLITVPLALLFAASSTAAPTPVESAPGFWPGALACVANGLRVAVIPVGLGLAALRRVVPGGAWRTGLAVGAGAGVLAGAVLQLHCPQVDLAHVTLAHGLAMILPALILVVLQVRRR
jgi:hypothetical protein